MMIAPPPLPFEARENAPEGLDRDGLARVRDAFASAAARAARLGIDAIQIHAAHGYLRRKHRTDTIYLATLGEGR